ncbi:TetR/AcrR family transcriptional regulator [Nocardiopsis valliformis]|uniref:TetR/AcrR family transcriptional regulator n=1 Tax=Nocardiopsis valliformis TaxID=239974 RepID=UPI00034B77EF|nr:TetR family transcriptional regulator C-terminal domain-containing protein [Nocardiopsis valliformis]
MSQTKARAVDAAIELLGTRGLHALTHGKVDAAAGLPKGSASNHFRTRDALVRGVVERLEELDRQDWARLYDVTVASADHLVDAVIGFVTAMTTTDRIRTVARYTLAMEAAHNPEVRVSLNRGHDRIREWSAQLLADLGAPDPEAAARTLLAYADGLIMHALTRPDIVEPREQYVRVVRACLEP